LPTRVSNTMPCNIYGSPVLERPTELVDDTSYNHDASQHGELNKIPNYKVMITNHELNSRVFYTRSTEIILNDIVTGMVLSNPYALVPTKSDMDGNKLWTVLEKDFPHLAR